MAASSEIEEDIPMAASSSMGKEPFGDDEVEEDIHIEDDDDKYSSDYE